MTKVAELRARQGRADDVVAALRAALIDGLPEKPGKYFDVARRLESWGMLEQAQKFAEQEVNAAGSDLLATGEHREGVKLSVRILTRLRQHKKAFSRLQVGLAAASSALPVIQEQLATQGIAAVTDSEWRQRILENRLQTARDGMRAAGSEMGTAVMAYFTPEERVANANCAEVKCAGMRQFAGHGKTSFFRGRLDCPQSLSRGHARVFLNARRLLGTYPRFSIRNGSSAPAPPRSWLGFYLSPIQLDLLFGTA